MSSRLVRWSPSSSQRACQRGSIEAGSYRSILVRSFGSCVWVIGRWAPVSWLGVAAMAASISGNEKPLAGGQGAQDSQRTFVRPAIRR